MPEHPIAVRRQWILAPEHEQLGHLERRVVITAVKTAGIVHLGIGGAQHVRRAGNARDVARVTAERLGCIRRTDSSLSICRQHRTALATGSTLHEDGLGPVVLFEVRDLLGKQIECLVPCNALPLVLAAVFARPLHRIEDAVGIVNVVAHRQAAHAQATARDGMVLVTFDLDEFACLVRIGLDAATNRMASRRRPCATARYGHAVFFEPPRLSQITGALALEQLHKSSNLA